MQPLNNYNSTNTNRVTNEIQEMRNLYANDNSHGMVKELVNYEYSMRAICDLLASTDERPDDWKKLANALGLNNHDIITIEARGRTSDYKNYYRPLIDSWIHRKDPTVLLFMDELSLLGKDEVNKKIREFVEKKNNGIPLTGKLVELEKTLPGFDLIDSLKFRDTTTSILTIPLNKFCQAIANDWELLGSELGFNIDNVAMMRIHGGAQLLIKSWSLSLRATVKHLFLALCILNNEKAIETIITHETMNKPLLKKIYNDIRTSMQSLKNRSFTSLPSSPAVPFISLNFVPSVSIQPVRTSNAVNTVASQSLLNSNSIPRVEINNANKIFTTEREFIKAIEKVLEKVCVIGTRWESICDKNKIEITSNELEQIKGRCKYALLMEDKYPTKEVLNRWWNTLAAHKSPQQKAKDLAQYLDDIGFNCYAEEIRTFDFRPEALASQPLNSQNSKPSPVQSKKVNLTQEQISNTECVICLDNPRSYIAIPCGHLAYCSNCVNTMDKVCVLCRRNIDVFTKVYIS